MKRIPPRPDLGQLKKQAKELLALYRADPACGDCRDRLRARLWPLLPAAVPASLGPAQAGPLHSWP